MQSTLLYIWQTMVSNGSWIPAFTTFNVHSSKRDTVRCGLCQSQAVPLVLRGLHPWGLGLQRARHILHPASIFISDMQPVPISMKTMTDQSNFGFPHSGRAPSRRVPCSFPFGTAADHRKRRILSAYPSLVAPSGSGGELGYTRRTPSANLRGWM